MAAALLVLASVACLLAMPRAARADVYVALGTPAVTVAPGDTFTVEILITQPDAVFNAFDASIRFDPAMLTFVPTTPVADQRGPVMTSACSNTFHKFTATPDSLKITLSLLCGGVAVTGPGTLYRVRFQAAYVNGTTTLVLGPFTNFYEAGLYVRPLHTTDLTVTIQGAVGVGPAPGGGERLEFAPPVPNPRRGGGSVALDFTLQAPDRVAFDVVDLQGRRMAGRDAESFAPGRHRIAWSPPALANGDYFIRLRTLSGGSVTQRWVVLR